MFLVGSAVDAGVVVCLCLSVCLYACMCVCVWWRVLLCLLELILLFRIKRNEKELLFCSQGKCCGSGLFFTGNPPGQAPPPLPPACTSITISAAAAFWRALQRRPHRFLSYFLVYIHYILYSVVYKSGLVACLKFQNSMSHPGSHSPQ